MILRKIFCSKFCLLIIAALIAAGYFGYQWARNLSVEDFLDLSFVKEKIGDENSDLFQTVPRLLGFTEPMTYLLLFENNTELRPGGGFIGSYALVSVNKGNTDIIKFEGTENFDRNTPEDWRPSPPAPLKEHLGVSQWFFRDANWSPDFSVSAKKALELYIGQGGEMADDIDAVIAITPTVLEEIVGLTGPITVEGVKFTAENFTETLEYEVEYDYKNKGKDFSERKSIMGSLMMKIMSVLRGGFVLHFNEYLDLFAELAEEKQIMFYALDENLEEIVERRGWSGEMSETVGDYLLWVDANLAALKTDHALIRELTYSISKNEEGEYLASADMKYVHSGGFDWRTSRYRTYTRIFVPEGSELVSVDGAMKWDRTTAPGVVDEGVELDRKWFGTFISIEPGTTKNLKFTYKLPRSLFNDEYTLFVQKPLGTLDHKLTLDLDFDTNITTATPSEIEGEHGNSRYLYKGDLKIDREFSVGFK